MDNKPIRVLVIEDDEVDADLLLSVLVQSPNSSFNVTCAARLQDAFASMEEKQFDVVISDLSLPDSQGIETVTKLHSKDELLPIIVLTGLEDEKTGREAVREGAQDFIQKDMINSNMLSRVIHYAIDRGQLLARLQQSTEERFRQIVEKNADGIVIVKKDGIIDFCNPAAEAIFYYESDTLVGQRFGFPLEPGSVQEIDIIRKDGALIIGEMRVAEVEWKNEVCYLVSVSDVTQLKGMEKLKSEILQRRQTEKQLQQKTRALESSNKELEQFAYVASHDLQEPLRKISAFSGLLMDKDHSSLDDESRDFLQRMNNAASRMSALIRDLLDLSRVSTSKKPFEKVDLNAIVRSVLLDMEITIRESHARVSPLPLPVVYADESQMGQLFQNLVGNALKYCKENEAPDVEIRSRDLNNGYVEVTVEDKGIGFGETQAERIFQPFQRLHAKDEYEGTGIGLAICKKIVERHNGEIKAKSQPGKGTTVFVYLPLRPSSELSGYQI